MTSEIRSNPDRRSPIIINWETKGSTLSRTQPHLTTPFEKNLGTETLDTKTDTGTSRGRQTEKERGGEKDRTFVIELLQKRILQLRTRKSQTSLWPYSSNTSYTRTNNEWPRWKHRPHVRMKLKMSHIPGKIWQQKNTTPKKIVSVKKVPRVRRPPLGRPHGPHITVTDFWTGTTDSLPTAQWTHAGIW